MEHAAKSSAVQASSQTLGRGLDVLEQVATGDTGLAAIAARLGLSRTTVHRLASSLVERRYLNLTPRRGYSLGPKLLELGCAARGQIALVRAAAPVMESLSEETGDSVVLSVREGDAAVIAAHAGGRRRVAPRLRVGERQEIRRGAAGLALLLDAGAAEVAALFTPRDARLAADFLGRLAAAAPEGLVADKPSAASEIVAMAAPVRGSEGTIVAALGLAMASPYQEAGMGPAARAALLRAGSALSAELGWRITNAHSGAPAEGAARELLGAPGTHRSAGRMARRGKAAVAATTTV